MRLDDPTLDQMASDAREALLLEALRRQIAFTRSAVPFWRDRLAKFDVDESKIDIWADLARIPILAKEELRALRPAVLLPHTRPSDLLLSRWTSGTSGRPTANFWSKSDWAALVASTSRMLGRQAPMETPIVFNGYSQSHMTGPAYNAALRRLGGVVYDRSHHPEELFSTTAQMELFDFDTLILPARAKRGKAVGLVDLLAGDQDLLARHGVRWWIGSSGTFEDEHRALVRKQGVESVSNLYGSSEVGPFGISCTRHPGDFHLAQGHILVEVVDASGVPVQSGQSGRVAVTHLCGMDDNGLSRTHTGTQILRLANGDAATFINEPCDCGLTTPRLRNIGRIKTTA
jgi:phenylacetate-coenzyme A ligase PaaK-like adenylate-forming protein